MLNPLISLATIMVTLLVPGTVRAQSGAGEPTTSSPPANEDFEFDPQDDPDASSTEFRFNFGGGYTHHFDTDIDSGGDFTVDTLSFGVDVERVLNRDASLIFRVDYGLSSYDFSGGIGIGIGELEPWSDINTLAFGGALSYDITDEITLFGGPVFQFSQETGADWADGFVGGGIVGMTYHFNDRLHLGGGVGIVSQIEDDIRLFPIIIIEWMINDQWRISSRGLNGGRPSIEFTGVELIWDPSETFEFALGGGSAFSRFRLDDEAPVADGVGQDESTPIWLRATRCANANFNLSAIGGVALGGELTLDDSSGDGVARSDYEAAPILGLFANVKF